MRTNNIGKIRQMPSGHTRFRSQTCIPVTSTANTAEATLSADLTVANTALFPAAGNLAKNFDKVKFHRVHAKWVPALPTTAGGSVALHFDSDRTDVGPTTMQEAAQNKGCTMGPLWDRLSYNVNKQMLRTAEWFTTNKGSVAGTENTFASPGRMHVHFTAQPGVTYTTAQTLGFLVVEYDLEFGFPSASVDTTVPTRRSRDVTRDTSTCVYNSRLVRQWRNFSAGCLDSPDFYQFLSLFDEEGRLVRSRALRFDPDAESLRLRPSALERNQLSLFVVPEVGDTNPFCRADVCSDSYDQSSTSSYPTHWSEEGEDQLDEC